ncbi:thrombopoietin-like isoform X2 [Hoplias malabaricus]|uniref:thrombopoietin-like isoform X2 n=1 Tax=Hoplias malabaricus TaxID=27720 RepID=UPI003461D8FE
MAVSRLLLLCVVFSEVQRSHTRVLDFVCSPEARSSLNIITALETAMKNCGGSDQLLVPIRLPCVKIRKVTWDQKSLQQKRASVCTSLGNLQQAVDSAKGQPGLACQSSILQRLKHNIQNHLKILRNLEIQGAPWPTEASCTSQETKSLTKTLELYGRLLRGPVEFLLLDLSETSCS